MVEQRIVLTAFTDVLKRTFAVYGGGYHRRTSPQHIGMHRDRLNWNVELQSTIAFS